METYEKALKLWGLGKLEAKFPDDKFTMEVVQVHLSTYTETMGYCDTCYSEDTYPSVIIYGYSDNGYRSVEYKEDYGITLDKILKELFEVADGRT